MKTISIFTALFLCSIVLFAQSPGKINYQTVIRDSGGNILANTAVAIDFEILEGSTSGMPVYVESHNVSTNGYGLVNIVIGEAQPSLFEMIDWSLGVHYLKVSVNGTEVSNQQLNSVPYALYSTKADFAYISDYNNILNAPTEVSHFNNDAGYITSPNDADADPSNEFQILTINNDTLYLSNSGFVSLSGYSDTLSRLAGTNIYNTNTGKLGVGTNTPPAKLVVQGDSTMVDTIPLFEVKDKSGNTVFKVYPDSVGTNSWATGYEAKAVGNWSQSLEYSTIVRRRFSTAIRHHPVSKGERTIF